MYTLNGKSISDNQAKKSADYYGVTLQEWASKYGWEFNEGKTTVPEETTPPAEPVKTTAAGDSSLADTSLESLESNPVQKALKRLADINIEEEYQLLVENANKPISTPITKQITERGPDGAFTVSVPTGEFETSFVYDSYKEQAEEILKANNQTANEKSILDKAKELYLNEERRKIYDRKAEEILEDFDDDIYTPLGRLKKYIGGIGGADEGSIQRAGLQKEVISSAQRAEQRLDDLVGSKIAQEAQLETMAVKLNEIVNKSKIDPSSITDEEREVFDNLRQSYNNIYSTYEETTKELGEVFDTSKDLQQLIDLTGRSYDNLDVAIGRVSSAVLNAAGGLLQFTAELDPRSIADRITGEQTTGYAPLYLPGQVNPYLLKETASGLFKASENITSKIEKRQALTEVKSIEDFLEFGLDLFTEQSVNTAVTAGIPGAGLMLISASAGGQKFREMDMQIVEGKKITPLQFYGTGLLYGLGEYVTEKVALDQFLGARKAISKGFDLEKVAEVGLDETTTGKAFAKYFGGINREGAAEAGAQFVNNFADRVILGDKSVGIFDGLGESYLTGGIMSGLGFGVPGLVTDVYYAASTGNEINAANKRSARIVNLKEKIDNIHINSDMNTTEAQEAVSELQQEIDELLKQNIDAMGIAEARVNELSDSHKKILLTIDSRSHKVKAAIDRVNKNNDLSKSDKASIISKYTKQLDQLMNKKDDLLMFTERSKGFSRAKVLQMKLAAESDLDFTIIRGEDIKDAENKAIQAVQESDISEENKQALIEKIKESANAVDADGNPADNNGFYTGAEQGFPITIFTKEGLANNASVVAHEVSHATIFKKIFQGNKDGIALAKELRKYTEKTFGKIAINKFKQIDQLYGKLENAKTPEKRSEIAEEIMVGVMELDRAKDLMSNKHKTLHGKIFTIFSNMMGKDMPTEIKTGKDVFLAIQSFNNSFDSGDIKGLFSDITQDKIKVRLANFKQKQAGTRFSISKSAERAKAQVEKMQEEGYDPNSYELYEALQGMVGAQLSKYQAKGLQITDEEEAVSDVVSRLYTQRDVNKFDGRGSAYGYLNGRIKFRILDAFKANPVWVENFEDVDVEGLSGKAAREVVEETVEPVVKTETIADVTPVKEYKNLLRRRVVEPEVIKSIEEKVLRTVRLLKSRIDAKVSKNVTITPIIREIKKEMGKQADIDFKKAMGGKKDGELRKFLLRNKAAILENMSTTWLSQAIPSAIQKSVEGLYTSNWQGKKIDRESVATDKAGRTSGAELVRRVPKVNSAISDSDFLANILQPDGNPIRGRKESLAKAMAEEISFDIIKQALEDPNSEISKALIENQKRLGVENAENLAPEFVRQSERGNVKFAKSLKQASEPTKRELFIKSVTAERLKNIGKRTFYFEKSINKILENNFNTKIFRLKNKEDLVKFVDIFIEKIAPEFPREFWLKENTIETVLLSPVKAYSGMSSEIRAEHRDYIKKRVFGIGLLEKSKWVDKNSEQWKNLTKAEKENQLITEEYTEPKWGDSIKGLEGYRIYDDKGVEITAEKIFETRENIEKYRDNGDLLRYNKMVETIHKEMWDRFYNIIQNDNEAGDATRAIATFLAASSSDTFHPQRRGATIAAYSDSFKVKSDITLEHATPNSWTIKILLEEAIGKTNNFQEVYNAIAKNYVLVGLNKKSDAIVNQALLGSFKKSMPRFFNYYNGNWGERYFNEYTKLNPNKLILISGKTYAEVAGIDRNGRYISDKFDKFVLDNPLLLKLLRTVNKEDHYESFISLINDERTEQDALSFLGQIALQADRFKDGQRRYSKSFPEPSILNAQFNAILRRKSGIDGRTEISRTRAQILGKDKGRFKFFIAPGADDFRGLVHYAFAGQGKQGEKDMEFFEKNLMDPYFRGIAAIDAMRQLIKREFKVVTTEFKDEYAMLSEPVPGGPFTYDHAVRVYMWGLAGTEVPGLSDKDRNDLENAILDNPALADLAEALLIVGRREAWPKPSEFWLGDSVLSDLNSMTEKVGRKEILAQFITNVDAIFDEAALNKIEAIKGRKHREALEDSIYAMKNGSNRPSGANIQTNKWINWINGSTGAIMFFNRRSALLQMLSFTNFLNWSDNNPIKAAAAFANQKQYWKDFVFIFNSDKLKERRGGLKQDVSESEIAQVAGRSKNSPQAILAYMLKLGFTPTQIADSMAIATGGATFYRNRINTYLKEGLSQKKAEEKAFEDFSKASDVAQQSSDPALVSQQQRSILGRFILAFANTPMQYTRLMKKAGQDLINGRGDAKEHISKILYYGFIQNLIFSALQSAMFGLFFDDEEDDETRKKNADKKLLKTVNSMVDTVLRGSGVYGAIVSTIKNTIQQYYTQEERGFMADHAYTLLSAFNVSPPIGSKFRKLYTAIQTKRFEEDAIAARGWAITADGRVNLGPNWAILGSLVSGAANVPLDRVYDEINSISEALDARNKAWQRIALALGWKTWDVGVKNEEHDLIETLAKEKRKQEGIRKRKETIRKKKELKDKAKRGPAFGPSPTNTNQINKPKTKPQPTRNFGPPKK